MKVTDARYYNENLKYARSSAYLGIAGMVAWLMPLIGFPVSITGLILGIIGHNSQGKDFARAGIYLGITGIFLSMIYLVLVIVLLSSGLIEIFE